MPSGIFNGEALRAARCMLHVCPTVNSLRRPRRSEDGCVRNIVLREQRSGPAQAARGRRQGPSVLLRGGGGGAAARHGVRGLLHQEGDRQGGGREAGQAPRVHGVLHRGGSARGRAVRCRAGQRDRLLLGGVPRQRDEAVPAVLVVRPGVPPRYVPAGPGGFLPGGLELVGGAVLCREADDGRRPARGARGRDDGAGRGRDGVRAAPAADDGRARSDHREPILHCLGQLLGRRAVGGRIALQGPLVRQADHIRAPVPGDQAEGVRGRVGRGAL